MKTNPHYNTEQYPLFIAHHSNWQIRARPTDWQCAAIAVRKDCQSTHIGDERYTRIMVRRYGIDFDRRKAVAMRRQKQIDERAAKEHDAGYETR